MGKGEETRQAILEAAADHASVEGFEGVTIGGLAKRLHLSKSGLFAHFQSKEALQLQVLEHVVERFSELVIRPALRAPRGEARLRALYDHWIDWPAEAKLTGGCVFVAGATELDDRPGPLRDRLAQTQRDYLDTIARITQTAIDMGEFRDDTDPRQIAHEFMSIGLGYYHAARLLRDDRAGDLTRTAFERLIHSVRRTER